MIVSGLERRRKAGVGGLSVMSCDNLPHNGSLARAAVTDFAKRHDPALAEWIGANVTFPATMVDRIVPALDAGGLDLVETITARRDENSIVTEPFRQWVIEDNFAAGRPDWGCAGAQMVPDVGPYEDMKLRMLNGAHSFLACLGLLARHRTVTKCMGDAVFRKAAQRLMLREQAPTLGPVPGIDLDAYAKDLIGRFSNSRLHHQTRQIATDTSAKLPQRLITPVAQHIASGDEWPLTALGIAGWMRLVRETVTGTAPLPYPLEKELRAIVTKTADGSEFVAAILAISQVFPADLVSDFRFSKPIAAAYQSLCQNGVRKAVTQACEKP